MNKMTKNQRGVTFLGWCVILAVIAVFVLITLRLFPLYNEKFIVIQAMNSVANRPDSASLSNSDVLKYFKRSVQIGGSTRFDDRSTPKLAKVEKPQAKGEARRLRVQFEARNKFYQDIVFVLVFDHAVELRGGSSGGG